MIIPDIKDCQVLYYYKANCRNNDLKNLSGWAYCPDIKARICMLEGLFHNETGPAIVDDSGVFQYRRYGKFCRLDGPAVTFSDGSYKYYIDDHEIPEKDYWQDSRIIKIVLNGIMCLK